MEENVRKEMDRNKHSMLMELGILAIIIACLFTANRGTETSISYDVENKMIELACAEDNGVEEPIRVSTQNITDIYTVDGIDLGALVSGIDSRSCQYGIWENALFGEYRLCADPDIDIYVVIETGNGCVVFNYESNETTELLAQSVQDFWKEST